MLSIIIAMLIVIVVSALVVTYVAFPHRGEEVPGAPWLGDAMSKGVDALPTLDEQEQDQMVQQQSGSPFDRAADRAAGWAADRADRSDRATDKQGPRHSA